MAMGIRITKMLLIFINILRAEEEMWSFISLSHSAKPPYITTRNKTNID